MSCIVYKIKTRIWISSHCIACQLWQLCGALMSNNGCLLLRSLVLKVKSSENFWSLAQMAKFWLYLGCGGRGLKSSNFYFKRHILAWIPIVWAILHKNWIGVLHSDQNWKKIKLQRLYISDIPRKLHLLDWHQICFQGIFCGLNQLSQILFQSVLGFWFVKHHNLAFSVWKRCCH